MNKIIFVMFISVMLLSIIFISGCTTAQTILDPCKINCEDIFQSCNHKCGEGLLSSICKEKCTYDYNRCMNNC